MSDTIRTLFHPAVATWFQSVFSSPTAPQRKGWPSIARGDSTLILAPTGSGKTLAAFLWSLNRLMFEALPETRDRCRVLYVSPLKALAVDIERNLRAPLAGISSVAHANDVAFHVPAIAVRTGDTPAGERARFQRAPADILITTPESLFLLLTSNARERLRSVETVILDEIHALVPTKRGAHLALSLERLEQIVARPLQRIGLSATQRPLEEVAKFLGGAIRRQTARQTATGNRQTGRRQRQRRQTQPTRCTTSSSIGSALCHFDPSPSSMRARQRSWRSASRRRSKTWRRRGVPSPHPAGRPVNGRSRPRSGRRSTPRWSSSSGRIGPRCCSSTVDGSPNAWRRRSTSWRTSRSCARITDRWHGRSGRRSRIC